MDFWVILWIILAVIILYKYIFYIIKFMFITLYTLIFILWGLIHNKSRLKFQRASVNKAIDIMNIQLKSIKVQLKTANREKKLKLLKVQEQLQEIKDKYMKAKKLLK